MGKFNSLEEIIAARGSFRDMIDFIWATRDLDQLFDAGHGIRMSTLDLFASAGEELFVKVLLQLGANINVRDSRGRHPSTMLF